MHQNISKDVLGFFLLWQICGPIYLKSKYWPESFVKENNNQKTSKEGSGK